MKTRVVLVNPAEDKAKPYKVQIKKFLFWHDYKYKIKSSGGDESVNVPQFYSAEEAKKVAINLLKATEFTYSTKDLSESKAHCL